MNPLSAALISGAIIVAGKWANKKSPNIDNAVGVAGIAIGLALMDQANEKLASMFAWLIVLSVAIVYVPKIAKSTGLA
jgi:hypothetical protein